MSYDEGVVSIITIPTVGHETVAVIVGNIIMNGASAGAGAGALSNTGSVDIGFGYHGKKTVQLDVAFRPSYFVGLSTPTLLLQVVDTTPLKKERLNAAALFASHPINSVQAILIIKLIRYQRPAVPQGVAVGAPRTIGVHTFSDPGFIGIYSHL